MSSLAPHDNRNRTQRKCKGTDHNGNDDRRRKCVGRRGCGGRFNCRQVPPNTWFWVSARMWVGSKNAFRTLVSVSEEDRVTRGLLPWIKCLEVATLVQAPLEGWCGTLTRLLHRFPGWAAGAILANRSRNHVAARCLVHHTKQRVKDRATATLLEVCRRVCWSLSGAQARIELVSFSLAQGVVHPKRPQHGYATKTTR